MQSYTTNKPYEVHHLLRAGWRVQSHTQPRWWDGREEWILSGSGDPWEIIPSGVEKAEEEKAEENFEWLLAAFLLLFIVCCVVYSVIAR